MRIDLEDSADKLHKANRYRHELELRYKAEKLTQERLATSLQEREDQIEDM